MKQELVFEITAYWKEPRLAVTQTVHALASTQEEAYAALKNLFEPRLIRQADGSYIMVHTLTARVIDGQGLIV